MSEQGSVFLERRSYRRRRMMDAVRILPVIGLALCMVPLMWQVGPSGEAEAAGTSMSSALLYVFGIWVFLVVIAAVLWRRTREPEEDSSEAEAG